MIRVTGAPALATVQDLGWRSGRSLGLPRSGALDPDALELANALVGNRCDGAGLELALGGLSLRFEAETLIALTGAPPAHLTLDQRPCSPGVTTPVQAGQTLTIGPPTGGRFSYLGVRGGIGVPPVLGSRSTYLPTGFGGLGGRRLRTGDLLPAGDQQDTRPPPAGFAWPGAVYRPVPAPIRVLRGPQAEIFPPAVHQTLEREPFTVAAQSDRMGTRLLGPAIAPTVRAALPSEGTALGAIQVPDGGQPIVILADGPTVGGYPKLAVVITADLGRFAQMPAGSSVRFQWVGMNDAQEAWHQARADLEAARALIRAGRPAS